jgi:hypothetical protein
VLAQRLDRRAHAGAGGQTVVDQDHRLTGKIGHGAALPVSLLTAQQFAALPLGYPLDDLRCYVQASDDIVIDDDYPATGDRPHGQLLAPRYAKLADHEDVEWSAEALRDLISHRHTASRQPQSYHVRASPVVIQQTRQHPARIPTITEKPIRRPGCCRLQISAALAWRRFCPRHRDRPPIRCTGCGTDADGKAAPACMTTTSTM